MIFYAHVMILIKTFHGDKGLSSYMSTSSLIVVGAACRNSRMCFKITLGMPQKKFPFQFIPSPLELGGHIFWGEFFFELKFFFS